MLEGVYIISIIKINIYVEDVLCFIYVYMYHHCCKLSELAWDMADVCKVDDINTFFLTQQLLHY